MSERVDKGRSLATLIAVIAWFGVALQLYLSIRLATARGKTAFDGVVLYFGFFTVLTNLLVCVAVTLPRMARTSAAGRFFARPMVIGWVTVSIVFVGVAYYVLLRHVWAPQGWQLVADVVMHYVVPVLFVLYSLIVLRGVSLRWSAPLWWSLYPIAYFVYVLARGAIVGSYPYGFIDAATLGYAVTVRNACMLWVAFLVLAYALLLVWRAGAGRINPPGRTPP